jgi:hypothetical protein
MSADIFYLTFRVLTEDSDFEYTMIDVSRPAPPVRAGLRKMVKVHRHGQGAKGGVKVRLSGALVAT